MFDFLQEAVERVGRISRSWGNWCGEGGGFGEIKIDFKPAEGPKEILRYAIFGESILDPLGNILIPPPRICD